LPGWMYVRIEDDGTDINFYVSSDGLTYDEIFSETRGNFFTTAPDQIGFAATTTTNRDVYLSLDWFRVDWTPDYQVGGGGASVGGSLFANPIDIPKTTVDTPDDEFNYSNLDSKWTAVSGSSGTVDITETGNVSKYDLATRPGYLLMQAGNNGSQEVSLRQDYTLPDGDSIIMAIDPSLTMDGASGLAGNDWKVGLSINDSDTTWNTTEYTSIHFDVEADGWRIMIDDGSTNYSTPRNETGPGLGQKVYLRLSRSGTAISASYSVGGKSWVPLGGTLTRSGTADNIWIFADNQASNSGFVPIQSVDWIRQGDATTLDPWEINWRTITAEYGNTLQDAYDNDVQGDADVSLTDGKDIVFNLQDTATDPNFTINLQGAGDFTIQDNGTDALSVTDDGNLRLLEDGTATAGTQYNSNELFFTGSAWDTTNTQAEDRSVSIKVITGSGADGSEPYRLAFFDNGGTEFVAFDGLNQRVDIDNATSTSNVDVFRIITDVGSADNVKFRIDSDGDIFTDGSTTIGTPADLAEKYQNLDGAGAGDVVVFTDNRTVAQSTQAMQPGLAGVVSSDPGLILSGNTPGVPVALAGRVPVKVTTENGIIQPGDYLTSSATRPGYAMRQTETGPTLGTAMEAFSGETGLIDLWVNSGQYSADTQQGPSSGSYDNLSITGAVDTDSLVVRDTATINRLNVLTVANIEEADIQWLRVVETATIYNLVVEQRIEAVGASATIEASQNVLGAVTGTCNDLVEIDGNDVSGTVSLNLCDQTPAGHIVTIKFNEDYDNVPRISLTAKNQAAADIQVYVKPLADNSGFEIYSSGGPLQPDSYEFDYIVIGAGVTSP
ncbi:MAG: hypothetical protein R3313_04795, partial [Candidatus Saccharimonadales bacterium]|nr:hypothetical protein [Candidatus Saccharimonadales bacterium]